MLISNTIRGLQRGMRRSVIAAWSRSAAFTSVEKQLGYSEFSSELPQVSVTAKDWRKGATESIIVIPFFEPVTESKAVALKALVPDSIPSDIKGLIDGVLNEGAFTGQAGSEIVLHLPSAVSSESTWLSKYIVMVGLGGSDGSSAKSCKALGKQLAALSWRHSGSSVGILPVGMELDVPQVLHGMFDASYHDMRFRKADASNGPKTAVQQNITIFTEREERTENYDHAYFIASGVKFAKDLVGAPANAKTPTAMASIAKELANQHGLECTVLGEAECVARGMGGYLAVQQGSKFPPQFIHMVYKPQHSSGETKKVVLIGKGLTFDSGGYNLKVGAGSAIETMKIDMGGLAAVLGCAKAIAQLKPANVEVHFVSAVCENMVSANAVRPGDVVTASNGKTIEVVNTDAEGRLTLADALVYAQTLGDVHSVIDLATLTGACIVGLGDKVAGLYSSDKQLLDELKDAAARSDEKVWHLPLEDSYRERIKSPIANIRNVGGGGGGGSITAALFLQEFVEKGTAWAHIDIAGPVWDDKLNKPTGYGVKMLVDYLMNVGAK